MKIKYPISKTVFMKGIQKIIKNMDMENLHGK